MKDHVTWLMADENAALQSHELYLHYILKYINIENSYYKL